MIVYLLTNALCVVIHFDVFVTLHTHTGMRREAPLSPAHIFCDVYLDVTSSFYNAWGVGTTTVRACMVVGMRKAGRKEGRKGGGVMQVHVFVQFLTCMHACTHED